MERGSPSSTKSLTGWTHFIACLAEQAAGSQQQQLYYRLANLELTHKFQSEGKQGLKDLFSTRSHTLPLNTCWSGSISLDERPTR
jgi:hypothetical protein